MKNILKIFSIEKIKNTTKRFPISVMLIILLTILSFLSLHYPNSFDEIYKTKILIAILSLIITIILSIWIYLSLENSNFSKLQKNTLQLIPIIFWIIFYNIFSLDPNDFENFLFFSLSLIWIIAYLFFAFYLKNLLKVENNNFFSYFYKLSISILVSFLFAIIIFSLWAIAITAILQLFDLDIRDKYTYWNWAILSFSFFSPLFFLTQIPDKKNILENNFKLDKFFSFLVNYIIIPFIFIYFFILYAYSIKVLLNINNWPKWQISWLVIWFSIFWYLAYIFSYPIETKSKTIKIFRKIFPYAVIPQIFMLFYAIYLRIMQYDLTVNRYFVVVFWIWLLFISLYFIISKKKNLIIIPSSLFLFIIIISIIPKYNVYSYPELRQFERLKQNLQKANILQNWKIVPLKNYNDIDKNLSKDIYSEINYLCDFNNCKYIKNLFPEIYSEFYKKWQKNKKIKSFKNPSKREIVNEITQKIKVKNYFSNTINQKVFNYSKTYEKDFFPINVKWYSKIYKIENYNKWIIKDSYWWYDIKNHKIYLIENWKIVDKINIKEIEEKLIKKFGKNDVNWLEPKDLIFEIDNWKYKLFFDNIAIINPELSNKNLDDYQWLWYTNWYLLVVK